MFATELCGGAAGVYRRGGDWSTANACTHDLLYLHAICAAAVGSVADKLRVSSSPIAGTALCFRAVIAKSRVREDMRAQFYCLV
jgi:hypothetical protein